MCRLAAYSGPPIALNKLLLDPPHSLYQQSWQAQELRYAKLNTDGFGFGWFGNNTQPASYCQTIPIWSDDNLADLTATLHAPLWLAMVRSATASYGTHTHNLQPFVFGKRLFMHNGFVKHFNASMRRDLLAQLDDKTMASLRGHTDSEHLCALIHCFASRHAKFSDALREFIRWCANYTPAKLNFIISDAETLYVMRHAIDENPPTLYLSDNVATLGFSPQSIVVASERLDSNASVWRPIPEHHIAIINNGSIETHAL